MDHSLFHQEKKKKQVNFWVQRANFLQLANEKEK